MHPPSLPSRWPVQRPVCFLHIRKTAGCSVRSVLFNRFPVAGSLLDCHHVGNLSTDPSSFAFVTGHVGAEYLARFQTRPIVFTVLRQPLDRAISAYAFFRSHTPAYLQWLVETLPPAESAVRVRFTQRANELPLVEFLKWEADLAQSLLSNPQTRSLRGRPELGITPGTEHQELTQAIENLRCCEVVGVTDRLDASLGLLARRLGWAELDSSPRLNVTQNRPTASEIEPAALDILRRWNALDAELYGVAEQLCLSALQSSPASAGPCTVPDAASFAFDQPIHGSGWYPRELVDRTWLCWMGSERRAWIDLQISGYGDQLLRCRGLRVLHATVLEGLRVWLNDYPLKVRLYTEGGQLCLEGHVPNGCLKAQTGRVRVTFEISQAVRPCDLDPTSTDQRRLGLAIQTIALTPASQGRWWPWLRRCA